MCVTTLTNYTPLHTCTCTHSYVWFHADGLPPQWELECHEALEADVASGKFYLAVQRTMEFEMHACEMVSVCRSVAYAVSGNRLLLQNLRILGNTVAQHATIAQCCINMHPLYGVVLWYAKVMNSADPIHFDTLHAPLPLPVLDKLFTAKHTITQVYGEGKRCV